MRTPAINSRIVSTLPVFFSLFCAVSVVWYLQKLSVTTPFILGIIAGALVDLDNRITGRLKNIVITMILFSISSLAAQMTYGTGLPFILVMTLLTFISILLGVVGLSYRTFAFGALVVAIYTTLVYHSETPWFVNPMFILFGTLLYSVTTLIFYIIFPNRPVQESMAAAYSALANYLDAKAAFFDPDEADYLEKRQIELAMRNTAIIETFNRCRTALFYRMRGQHRHPRTLRMLHYYFAAQDIHERISSVHVDYRDLSDRLKNTDLIFRIGRLLELQGQACRDIAECLRNDKPYQYSERLGRAVQGCRQSLKLYAEQYQGREVHAIQRLLENLFGVDYQLSHLENSEEEAANEKIGIAATETGGLRHAWRTIRSQLNFESAVFRHAVRLSIVFGLTCSFVEISQYSEGYWVLLTILLVCQPNYSATKSRINQRIVGTVLGVCVGSLVPYFTPSVETKLWIVLASATLFFFFRTNKFSFSTFFITVQALTSMSLAGLDVFDLTWSRLLDTLVGSVIAWAAVSYLWPDWRYLTLKQTGAKSISSNGNYLHHIISQFQNGNSDDMNYRIARRKAHEAAAALSSSVSDMSSQPRIYGNKLQDGFNLLKISYALIGYISALGAYRNRMANSDDSGFTKEFFSTADQVADILENIALYSEADFQTARNEMKSRLAYLQTLVQDDRQNNILWQQISLIAGQLEPCYTAIQSARSDNIQPLAAEAA